MDIFEQLRRDEGSRNFPYTDTVGKLTIGVGRNLTDRGLANDEINDLLVNDVNQVKMDLTRSLPWYASLDEARRGVLENMAFNMGLHGLLAFHKMLTFMEAGEYDQAATEMLNSKWSAQVGDRAKRLALQLQTGEWQ